MKRSILRSICVLGFVIVTGLVLSGPVLGGDEVIFRPGPGLNDGTDDGGEFAGKDAMGGACIGPATNDGTGSRLYSTPRSDCNACNIDSFIQFDLSTLPDYVESVFFGVTHLAHDTSCHSNCNADFYFYPLTGAWDETSVNLNNAPGIDSAAYGPINITFPNDFQNKEYDITDLYRGWKDNSIPNYGMKITSPTVGCNNGSVAFYVYSSDTEVVGDRPYLRIVPGLAPTIFFSGFE